MRSRNCGLGGLGGTRPRCGSGQFPIQRLKLTTSGCRLSGNRPVINRAADVAALVREHFRALPQESVVVLLLNNRNEVVSAVEVSLGGVAAAQVDPRLILGAALVSGVPAIVVAHNHPSGDPEASADDVNLTRVLRTAATACFVKLLDHVIVGSGDRYYSFADSGRL